MRRLFITACIGLMVGPVQALDYSGNIAAEVQLFPREPQFVDQYDDSLTLSFQPRLRFGWNERRDELSLELFLRGSGADDNREHADIRELKWLHVDGPHEWRIGFDIVFWGVTESQHLVDVINQTDRLEGIDGEDKLGQPMLHYTTIQDWGVFHVFVLPGFREAEFRRDEGRLRFPLAVADDLARFESDDEESHIDYALRYTHFIGDTEFGLALFDGTSRDPILQPGLNGSSQPVLIPFYPQITQIGVDVQTIVENWLWKIEMIHRDFDSVGEDYSAVTAGFEYTFYGIAGSIVDLGTLLEYSWEDREVDPGVFDNDVFAGLRFAFNDVQSSEILGGIVYDTDKGSQTLRVEASRRLGDSWKLTGEMQVFSNIDVDDPLFAFSRDDFMLVELAYYF